MNGHTFTSSSCFAAAALDVRCSRCGHVSRTADSLRKLAYAPCAPAPFADLEAGPVRAYLRYCEKRGYVSTHNFVIEGAAARCLDCGRRWSVQGNQIPGVRKAPLCDRLVRPGARLARRALADACLAQGQRSLSGWLHQPAPAPTGG